MRLYTDSCGRSVADHGLGGHYAGGPALGVAWGSSVARAQANAGAVSPTNPCPPQGYPNHTQWNGQSCCIPQACVPKAGTMAVVGCGSNCRKAEDGQCYCQTPAGNWKNSPGCCAGGGARPSTLSPGGYYGGGGGYASI